GLSSRLRMSVWTFGAPFIKTTTDSTVTLDQPLLDLLRQARLDDVSLVRTVTLDPANPPGIQWAGSFRPAAKPKLREPYLREPYLRSLIKALHAIGVQVIAGYEIVESGKKRTPLGMKFTDWLAKASAEEIEKHATAIAAFFDDRGLDIDGIGFD